MGQTLTHGVYLPDEGERNCYNGLAANWQILDGAVGTIAEHTSALSGKAPLVHTHSKSDITDFPAYGTTAGTICEGNDSRLSDARTPVAHTHGKADITDLFNSANVWTANNTFSAGAYFYNSDSTAATSGLNLRNSKVTKGGTSDSGSQIIQFLDKDNKFLSQVATVKALSGTTQLQFILGNIDSNNNSITGGITFSLAIDGTKQFLPNSDSTHNLGNGSYQWNNLYAKNYYYNGVAWGLDKENVWSATQIIKQQAVDIVNNPSARKTGRSLYFQDGTRFWSELRPVWNTDGSFTMELGLSNYTTGGAQGYWNINARISKDFSTLDFYTSHVNANLGTSTNKWKTLNGINPGALSFPSASYIDISSNITDRNYGANYYTAPSDGYVCIGSMASSLQISNDTLGFGTTGSTGQDGYASAYIPVRTGNTVRIQVNQTTTDYQYFSFYPCAGNV